MLRDNLAIIGMVFVGMVALFLVGYYMITDFGQNTVVQGMTETVRVTAMENADHSSRLSRGEFYIDEEGFEESFKEAVKGNANIEGDVEIDFDYLKGDNGSVKAIKVLLDDGKETYQTTVQVDISGE